MMKKFLRWFIVSSANPTEYSLSLKGLLIGNIGVIMFLLHTLNVSVTVDQVTDAIGFITAFYGSALFVAGMLRKMYRMLFPSKI